MRTKWLVVFHTNAGTHMLRANTREDARRIRRLLRTEGRRARILDLRPTSEHCPAGKFTLLRAA